MGGNELMINKFYQQLDFGVEDRAVLLFDKASGEKLMNWTLFPPPTV